MVWSGEFGRTPWSQDLSGTAPIEKHGRDHQPESFTAFLAGGGVKRGMSHGETDEFGYQIINGRVHIHDLHATMLHLLGLDHKRLTYRFTGRDYRLTDVSAKSCEKFWRSPANERSPTRPGMDPVGLT